MKQIIKYLEAHCSRNEIGREYALDKFLDFLITFFDLDHYRGNWMEHVKVNTKIYPELMAATLEWMELTARMIESEGWYDSLGHLYEVMYQSKNKASALGQFFTPDAVCDLMAKTTSKDMKKPEKICDSACGSGRTLLAAFQSHRTAYFIGEDIDSMSVRMCALNLMIHGARGRTLCHDSLSDPIHFNWGYEINEIRYPFPNIFYSVRRISFPESKDEKKAETVEKPILKEVKKISTATNSPKHKPGDQLSLFD